MKYQNEIAAYIDAHTEEMIEDIFTLCRINSERMPAEPGKPYGPGPAEALSVALKMAESYGFATLNYDNYVGTVDLNGNPKQLDILAHLDVVPAGEGWQITEPFSPILKDGRLYGRGTSDDKGPAVAALYAFRCVKELGLPVSKNVRLILGCDEECGSSDIAHYYKIEKEAPMTFSPDADFPLTNIEKGRLAGQFDAEFAASPALPRLVSVDAGIKVNVVPGKAFAVVEGLDLAEMRKTAADVTAETGVEFLLEVCGSACGAEDAAAADIAGAGAVSDAQTAVADAASGEKTAGAGAQAAVAAVSRVKITAVGEGAHAASPQTGNNALTGLLTYLTRLPFAPCPQITAVANLLSLMPHGDVNGKAMGIDLKDDISGELTLAFSMLKVTDCRLEGMFDTRCPVCATVENMLNVAKAAMAAKGITLHNDSFNPPHHVDENSHFVQTLLAVYEAHTGLKGECQSMGGGTYVHHLENGVAFGASMPGTDNRMHGADERAVLYDLVTSAKIFAQAIVELCE